jgi:hypothetical protein
MVVASSSSTSAVRSKGRLRPRHDQSQQPDAAQQRNFAELTRSEGCRSQFAMRANRRAHSKIQPAAPTSNGSIVVCRELIQNRRRRQGQGRCCLPWKQLSGERGFDASCLRYRGQYFIPYCIYTIEESFQVGFDWRGLEARQIARRPTHNSPVRSRLAVRRTMRGHRAERWSSSLTPSYLARV